MGFSWLPGWRWRVSGGSRHRSFYNQLNAGEHLQRKSRGVGALEGASQPAPAAAACIQIRPRRAAAQLRFLLPPSPHRTAAEWRSARALPGLVGFVVCWHNSAPVDHLCIHICT
ncbi:hypothetical protein EJB05_36550, partial [Eragrostis curvula]